MRNFFTILLATVFLTSCSVVNQITGLHAFSQSEYSFNSISNIQLGNMNLGGGQTLSLANIAAATSLLSGMQQSIPLGMTINLDVTNPNPVAAVLNSVDFDVIINDMQLTSGVINTPIRIEGGQTAVMPISIGVDLRNLINSYSQQQVSSAFTSFLGITNNPANITVRLRPSLMVGNTAIPSPVAIPVSFNFGGR